jgi:hypothetical protein
MKTALRFAILTALVCAVALPAAAAQDAADRAKAVGVVRTAAGDPVPGAAVRITHLASGQAWATWTDDSGKFELPGVPAGRYRIQAQQLGFDAGAVEVEFKNDAGPEAELKLKVAGLAAPTPAPAPAAAATPAAANGTANGTAASAPTSTPPANGTRTTAPAANPGAPSGRPRGESAGTPAGTPGGAQPARPSTTPQRGFQQIDPTQMTMGGAAGQGAEAPPLGTTGTGPGMDAGPLGDASSSDAFLMNGTVARGATAGGGFNPGALMGAFPFGIPGMMGGMDGGGFPGGAPGAGGGNPFGGAGGGAAIGEMMVFIAGGGGAAGGRQGPGQAGGAQGRQGQQQGRGQGQQAQQRGAGQQGQGQPGQPAPPGGPQTMVIGPGGGGPGGPNIQFGEGMGALMGAQRLMRQAANRIRFSFYNRYGHSAADARSYSLTDPNPVKIASYRETFGVSLGGPLRLGKLYDGRDKTFFFLNYDLSRRRNPSEAFATVPLAAERSGDFTARGVQLFDPFSNLTGPRTPLGSVIPTGMLDPAAVGLLPFIPLPNLPGTVQNFHLQGRVPNASDRFNVRLSHTLSPKLSINGNYSYASTRAVSIPTFPTLRGRQDSLQQAVTLGLTHQPMQRVSHNVGLNWSRNRSNSLNSFAFVNDIAGNLGITGISPEAINFGVPQINFTNLNDLNDPVPNLTRNQTLRLTDNVSWSKGKHTWRFGGEMRRQQINRRNDPTARGNFSFTGLMTSQLTATGTPVPGTGSDFADFLLGLPQSTNVRFGSSRTYLRNWTFLGYMQDDWRWHPRFSVNWGLRYEATTPYTELYDKLANLDMNSAITAVGVVVPGQIAPFSGEVPRSLIRGDFNNWQPRLGIAWRPKLKRQTSVRAGYSIFHNASIYGQLVNQLANQPPHASSQQRLTSSALVLTLVNGFPPVPPNAVANTYAVDPNYRVGYAQIWNTSVETQLMRNVSLELTYTGTKGTHLDLLRSPNRSVPTNPLGTEFSRRIPNAPGFTYDTFGGSSIYHALMVRVTKRMTRGFMLFGTYTFGKSIDNASSIGGGSQVVVQDDNNFDGERGLSTFDVRHRINSFLFYDLPFGERKRWARRGWQAAVFSNFTLNSNVTWQTGTPFTARLLGSAANNSGTGNSFSERPDQIASASLPRDQREPLLFFNTAAFVLPPAGRFGNAGRNTIPGPGTFLVNGSFGRWIAMGKDRQRRLDIRLEIQNLFNTPNFTGLNTVVNSQTYGRVQGARQMRTLDLQMRFNF